MDFNPQGYTPDGVAFFGKDDQLLVKFSRHPELSQEKLKKAGMPIYDDVEIVTVIHPGEKEPVIVKADEFHKRRFQKQYEAFLKGIELSQTGTPLELLFPSEPSTVKSLHNFNIFTIQQLAKVSDSAKANIPMGGTLSDRAKAYLSQASDGQNFHTAMAAMQKQIEELKAKLADNGIQPPSDPVLNLPPETEPQRRGPGRPRKEPAAA